MRAGQGTFSFLSHHASTGDDFDLARVDPLVVDLVLLVEPKQAQHFEHLVACIRPHRGKLTRRAEVWISSNSRALVR